MAKSKGMFGIGFKFKKDNPNTKTYKGIVNGNEYTVTAVSERQAALMIKIKHNRESGLQDHIYQKVEVLREIKQGPDYENEVLEVDLTPKHVKDKESRGQRYLPFEDS